LSLNDLEARLRPAFLAALAGDRAAYRVFLEDVSVRLRVYLRGQLRKAGRSEPSEAEDVLQEILLALHLSQRTYDPSSPLLAWVHAIARYKLVDHLRRTGRHAGAASIDEGLHLIDESNPVSVETRLDLADALRKMPERTRTLVEQVKLHGHSVADAARAVGMSENAAKVAIHRGLRKLALLLEAPG
jgi:RNA polymerase sigma factor (sigma-70 family)